MIKLNEAKDKEKVGNKAFALFQLINNGFRVPNGFVVPHDFKISSTLKNLKRFIEDNSDKNKLYAVRSSSNLEDSKSHSYAGMFETYLGVTKEELLEKCLNIMKISENKRLKEFCKITGKKENEIKISALVQEMVDSEISGICFTKNPVTNNKNEILIEAGLGLGEFLVQAEITPETYIIDKKTKEITNKKIVSQHKKLKLGRPNIEEDIFNYTQKLSDEKISELAEVAIKIEIFMGYFADIEWAVENNILYILQSRPIVG